MNDEAVMLAFFREMRRQAFSVGETMALWATLREPPADEHEAIVGAKLCGAIRQRVTIALAREEMGAHPSGLSGFGHLGGLGRQG